MKYEPGCYGDATFGSNHVSEKVFAIAADEGWNPIGDEWLLDSIFDGKIGSIPPEVISELEYDAIDYLNEHCSDSLHHWAYLNGDFGYWEMWDD